MREKLERGFQIGMTQKRIESERRIVKSKKK